MTEQETVRDLIIGGLCTDGEHHKQWYLEQIAKALGIDLTEPLDYEKGIAPLPTKCGSTQNKRNSRTISSARFARTKRSAMN